LSWGGGERLRVVDAHCHVLSQAAEEVVRDYPQKKAEPANLTEMLGEASVKHNAAMMDTVLPKLTSLATRLADMDAMGVDIQILSPSPTQYYYWADRDLTAELVSKQNETIAAACEAHPGRFAGLAAVSLQFPELAAQQLDHCVRELGFKGAEISSHVSGTEIADPQFAPFWQKAEELGAVIFLHPLGVTLRDRLREHYLANIIGVPLETTIALSHLIYGGILDDYPRLKILAAHGGGFFSHFGGRFDHGWEVRPECRHCKHPPSEYLKRIYFDTIVHEPSQLRLLVERVGARRLILGTDYPFDMGCFDPLEFVQSSGLSEIECVRILAQNATELFGLE
jgi:aminocarboxymuconate-semialdehyde decarboxylase